MHLNSQLLFKKHALPKFQDGQRVLEIGPDGHPSTFRKMLGERAFQWDTIDIFEDPRLTFRTQGEYGFPVPDATYDIVLSAQVVEHVRKTWVWMKELTRVCKPGGLVITINPVSWGYHEAPIDCWRIYPEGMKALHEEAGLETELSVFESLEPLSFRAWRLVRIGLRALRGRLPSNGLTKVVDTISIARKPLATTTRKVA